MATNDANAIGELGKLFDVLGTPTAMEARAKINEKLKSLKETMQIEVRELLGQLPARSTARKREIL